MPNQFVDPTPAEIAERAAAIRASWDEQTRLERRADYLPAIPWDIPVVNVREVYGD